MSIQPPPLPTLMNTIIGRAAEIASLTTALKRHDVRLLTLTGPGGVGKTRLALEVAHALRSEFCDGIFFVSLAPLRECELVLPTIAQVMGIENVAGQPLVERLKDYLRHKQLLLVLDNFEHVLPAGPLVADLLLVAPAMKVLATSREQLHLYGEHECEVLPLALLDLSSSTHSTLIAPSAAMNLFIERAQAAKPSFTCTDENVRLIAEICTQLDGLPLAIELAAARVKLLPLSTILTRLQSRLNFLTGGARNLPARHQTLRNTLDWSYQLLNEQEQCFFYRLGVLIDTWTLEAATFIAMPLGDDVGDAIALLTSLVDKSFVRVLELPTGDVRYMLLETIREYALERLEQSGEREVTQRRHAQFYMRFAREVERHLSGREQKLWLERLDHASANLLAALRWVVAAQEATLALQLVGSMVSFIQLRSSLNEARNWFEEALALDGASQETPWRMRTLYGAGLLACMHNESELAQHRLYECNVLAETLGDYEGQILSLGMLATLELQRGSYEGARSYAEQGSSILEKVGNRWYKGVFHSMYGKIEAKHCNFEQARVRFHISLMLLQEVEDLRTQADVLAQLGNIMRLQGKLKTALFLYTRSLKLLREIDARWNQPTCMNGIGDIKRLQGSYAEARDSFEECLNLTTQLSNSVEKVNALTGLGQLALYQGDMRLAARYLKESLRLTQAIEYTSGLALLLLALGDLERYQENYASAKDYYEQCLPMTRTMHDKVSMAGALFGLGDVARRQQENARACMLLKQSLQLSWETGDRLGLAASLETFAWFCQQIGLPERAVQFLGTAASLRDWLQIPLAPTLAADHERAVTSLHNALGEIAFHESWAYGHTMTLKLALSMIARIPIPGNEAAHPEKPSPTYPAGLTTREVDVLRLVATGLPDARIAEQLVISPRTVNTHLRSIYGKLGVSSRSAATRFALDHKLV